MGLGNCCCHSWPCCCGALYSTYQALPKTNSVINTKVCCNEWPYCSCFVGDDVIVPTSPNTKNNNHKVSFD